MHGLLNKVKYVCVCVCVCVCVIASHAQLRLVHIKTLIWMSVLQRWDKYTESHTKTMQTLTCTRHTRVACFTWHTRYNARRTSSNPQLTLLYLLPCISSITQIVSNPTLVSVQSNYHTSRPISRRSDRVCVRACVCVLTAVPLSSRLYLVVDHSLHSAFVFCDWCNKLSWLANRCE